MPRLIKIAVACGAFPLLAGTAIYIAWRLTRWNSMELLGLYNVIAGVALFVLGMGCLIYQCNSERRACTSANSHTTWRNAIVAALLLLNFPAAAVYGVSAIDVMSRFTVRIANDSGTNIDSLEIQGIGFKEEMGTMRAGDSTRIYIRRFGEGGAGFTARQGSRVIEGELCGYLAGGEDVTLRFLPEGKFEVRDNRNVDYLARD